VKSIGPHVSPAHDAVEFVVRDSHHQIASNDAAAHPTAVQEGEAAEHLAFGDVVRVPNAWRMRFASGSSYAMGTCA